ncbi:hypothetical protein SDC9_169194 [bioreactor metagenome]|uniref:Uncharacterized protein n=1 Tax=bioreactor metagenome TaxID=1076179 RepID=A0A645G771_9ZZZZ
MFSYAEISLTAEKLHENLLLIELSSNLKTKELSQDRIGKISELREKVAEFNSREKVSETISDFYYKFQNGFLSFVKRKKEAAFKKGESQIVELVTKFEEDLEILKGLLEVTPNVEYSQNFDDQFYSDYEIIIDNTGEQELVYMKRIIS